MPVPENSFLRESTSASLPGRGQGLCPTQGCGVRGGAGHGSILAGTTGKKGGASGLLCGFSPLRVVSLDQFHHL